MKLPNLRNPVANADVLSERSEKIASVTWIIGKR
jgi:hypothetical protein